MYEIPKDMSPENRAAWEAALAPIHPGELLDEEFLKPLGMSRNALAMAVGVPAPRINEIALGKRSITADTALRLGTYFSVSPEFWLGIQADYDLATAKLKMREDLERIKPRGLMQA
jgi:addiction module HigA family antidote